MRAFAMVSSNSGVRLSTMSSRSFALISQSRINCDRFAKQLLSELNQSHLSMRKMTSLSQRKFRRSLKIKSVTYLQVHVHVRVYAVLMKVKIESHLSTCSVRVSFPTSATRPDVSATRGKFSAETTAESPLRRPTDDRSQETLK